MTFGAYLRETRRRHQLPLGQLAACTHLSREALQDLETNRRTPSYAELLQLAMALRRPEAELLERAGLVGHQPEQPRSR
jgi:transcriptional regulator with XRE-family HTH domain